MANKPRGRDARFRADDHLELHTTVDPLAPLPVVREPADVVVAAVVGERGGKVEARLSDLLRLVASLLSESVLTVDVALDTVGTDVLDAL
jgi:hypothetical protein